MKTFIKSSLLVILLTGWEQDSFSQATHPVFKPGVEDIDALKKSVEPLMKMSVAEVIALVPTAGGFKFVGCPNCNGGAQEDTVLGWELGMGDNVRCHYCKMTFPNEKFPNNREKVIIAPSGARQVYRHYESPDGREYHYESHAWYERWMWINPIAERLARLWYATKDNDYGDRAAAIAGRFAQVYPDYAIRHDLPYVPVKYFPANQKWPYQGVSSFRGAKWSYWAYKDMPVNLANVYDILKAGYDWKRMDSAIGPETDRRIADDLLRMSYDYTSVNPDNGGNMAPGMYRDIIRVGRILNDPVMVHEAVARFRELISKGFFADGWWKEGTVSYHDQTVNGLRSVNEVLKGYSDPPDWKGERFDNLDLTVGIPLYQKALNVSQEALLPDGRPIPINDTWANKRRGSDPKTSPAISRLWPSLGNAALASGQGPNQIMLNLNWSGNYGHAHSDNGAIILFAQGQELLADIGYTHTKYRGWTVQTPSHNLVVIDQTEQDKGSARKQVTGHLQFYDDKDLRVKAIDVDASPAYSIAKTYRRRLVMVNAGPGMDYVIDRFDVEGGKDHDWFLHGMMEQEGTMETSISLNKQMPSLVPAGAGKKIPVSERDTSPEDYHPYNYLQNVKSGAATANPWTATWRYNEGVGLRVHNISPAGAQVYRFQAPSIRRADEDELKLNQYKYNGIMQRNSGKPSSFIAVHEPFRSVPWIESVQKKGDVIVVRYKLDGNSIQDSIIINEQQITVNSSAGWKYDTGTARSGRVQSIQTEGGKYRLQLDKEVPNIQFIRLDLAQNETRYYPVAAVQGRIVELVDDPGFTIAKDGKVAFHTFPGDQFTGPLNYTVFIQKEIN